jgi:hypothetical protein
MADSFESVKALRNLYDFANVVPLQGGEDEGRGGGRRSA